MLAEDITLLDRRQRTLFLTAIAVTRGSVNFLGQNSQVQILRSLWEEGQEIPEYVMDYVTETLSLEI